MNIAIKIKRHDISYIQQLFNLMFQINIEFIDYVSFYNISNILKKIQKVNFNSNFNTKKIFTINLTPNEAQEFIQLVNKSNNLINKNPYHIGLIIEIVSTIQKQLSTLESQKNNLANNLILTIPKTLNRRNQYL